MLTRPKFNTALIIMGHIGVIAFALSLQNLPGMSISWTLGILALLTGIVMWALPDGFGQIAPDTRGAFLCADFGVTSACIMLNFYLGISECDGMRPIIASVICGTFWLGVTVVLLFFGYLSTLGCLPASD